MNLSDKTKLALVKAAPNMTTLELIEAIEAEFKAIAPARPIAMVSDWGIDGPKFKGLTNEWPVVGTVLYTIEEKK